MAAVFTDFFLISTVKIYFSFRLTPLSQPNKAGLNIHLSVHKKLKFCMQVEVNVYYMMVCVWRTTDVRSRSPVWNVRKWPISKHISSASLHVIKRLMVNYDTPRQYLNYNCTDFWQSSSFGIWPLTSSVPPLANEFCLLRGVDWQCYTGLI